MWFDNKAEEAANFYADEVGRVGQGCSRDATADACVDANEEDRHRSARARIRWLTTNKHEFVGGVAAVSDHSYNSYT